MMQLMQLTLGRQLATSKDKLGVSSGEGWASRAGGHTRNDDDAAP